MDNLTENNGTPGPRGERGPKGDHGQAGAAGPRGQGARHRALIGYLILCAMVLLGFFMSYRTDRHVEEARQERVQQLNNINKQQCQEIEELKMQFREDAIEDFRELPETLRLLNVPPTEEIIGRAAANRDEVLRRFKKGTCPRNPLK